MTGLNDAAVKMIRLTPDLMVPLDAIKSVDWRRKWDQAQSRKAAGENMTGAIATLLREAQAELGPDILLRAAQRAPMSIMVLGVGEEHGAVIRPLSERAQAHADEEKKREGIKPDAGRPGVVE